MLFSIAEEIRYGVIVWGPLTYSTVLLIDYRPALLKFYLPQRKHFYHRLYRIHTFPRWRRWFLIFSAKGNNVEWLSTWDTHTISTHTDSVYFITSFNGHLRLLWYSVEVVVINILNKEKCNNVEWNGRKIKYYLSFMYQLTIKGIF